jgi:putative Mg2+ transporter-C (MgtC) family protein
MESINWHTQAFDFLHLFVAFVLTAVIGWNREQESHNVGIRAFPIVGTASCAYLMIAFSPQALQGLMTGIGFVGGGAIVKEGVTIHGTATAASVWCAGAIGAAVATDHWALAVWVTAMNLIALRGLAPLKDRLDKTNGKNTTDS